MALSPIEQSAAGTPLAIESVNSDPKRIRGTGLARLYRRPSFGLSVFYIIALIIVAIAAPFIATHDPIVQNMANALASSSSEHWLGTDDLGRDTLSRLIWGARPTLVGTIVAIVTACAIGLPWGLVSGYAGGVVDLVLMRVADSVLVFPGIVLALALTAVLGPSLYSTMVALGIVFSPVMARIVRAGVLTVSYKDFVVVTKMYGLSPWHRVVHHVLPNVMAPTMVQITLLSGLSVLVQTGLNFLGLGVPNPNPSWGSSVSETFRYVVVDPTAPLIPGIAIVCTVLALYRIGDECRDLLDLDR
jgi:peptide/nickel transport system permease protein